MSKTCMDYEIDSDTASFVNNGFFDESFLPIDLDCSLSYSDFTVSDSILNSECSRAELPTASTEVSSGASRINFCEVLKGLKNFAQHVSDETSKDNLNNIVVAEPAKVEKVKKKQNGISKGQRYNPSFKQKVMKYAVKHTFKETADKYNINCNTLTEWAREYKRLLQLKKSTTAKPGFKCKTDVSNNLANNNETDALSQRLIVSSDANFIAWLRSKRLNGIKVKRDEVLSAGLEFLQSSPDSSPWFTSWVHRLTKAEASNLTGINETEKHIFYSNNFKTEVALYANEYTKSVAAKTFGLSTRRLYAWCDLKNAADSNSKSSITALKQSAESQLKLWYNQECVAGARPKSSELAAKAQALYSANGLAHLKCSHGWLEKIQKRLNIKLCHGNDDPLICWILSQLDNNHSLSLQEVTSKATELAAQSGDSSFKGSKGWTLRFLKRHSHILQCTSAQLSNLPAMVAQQARQFSTRLQEKMSEGKFSSDHVGCMDEVPITFHFPTDKVQTPRLLRRVCLETAHAVVLLSATSNGILLPPAVVFKGSNAIQTFQHEGTSIPVFYQPNGTVETTILREWCQHVWLRYVGSPTVLVLDSFTPHQNGELQDWLASENCQLAIIPAGCALHLQPCSLNLSHSFQESVQEKWLEYSSQVSCPEWKSRTGPDEMMILKWIVGAYRTLREDTHSIKSSFHLAGWINSLTCASLVHK